MPDRHRRTADWTPERLIRWARSTGEATAAVVAGIMDSRPHPEQGFRACPGIMRLAKSFGPERCEAACKRALAAGSLRYRSVESILKRGLDQLELEPAEEPVSQRIHENIRGPHYCDHTPQPMLASPTLRQLQKLKLDGMAASVRTAGSSS